MRMREIRLILCAIGVAAALVPGHARAGQTAAVAATTVDGKSVAAKAVEPEAEPPYQVAGTTGYDSLYMWRGVPVQGKRGAVRNLLWGQATLETHGFTLGVWGAGTPTKNEYDEFDASLAYSHEFEEIGLELSGSYSYYLYPWDHSDTHELFVSAAYTHLPIVTPSIGYYHDVDMVDGGILQARVEAELKAIPERLTITPFALVTYDFRYNSDSCAWNNFEAGVQVRVELMEHLALIGYGSVAVPMSAIRESVDTQVWGGCSLEYSF
jgi:hypothetical protein